MRQNKGMGKGNDTNKFSLWICSIPTLFFVHSIAITPYLYGVGGDMMMNIIYLSTRFFQIKICPPREGYVIAGTVHITMQPCIVPYLEYKNSVDLVRFLE